MIVFEIRDKAQQDLLLGYLFYYERNKRFFSEILGEMDEWSAPFIFSGHIKKGIYSIDSIWSMKFVRQRIIPPDRQNLGSILRENGLKEYDEWRLLQLSEGRCAQDELYLRKISDQDILLEIKKRLEKKVLDVMVLGQHKVLVFLKNGESRIVNVQKLCGDNHVFGRVLREEDVFRNVRVSPGGNGIDWGEERFLSAEILRQQGKPSEIHFDDVAGFIRERLCDPSETTALLHCSRQYVKQLVDKERLTPIREDAHANLYLKSALERDE